MNTLRVRDGVNEFRSSLIERAELARTSA